MMLQVQLNDDTRVALKKVRKGKARIQKLQKPATPEDEGGAHRHIFSGMRMPKIKMPSFGRPKTEGMETPESATSEESSRGFGWPKITFPRRLGISRGDVPKSKISRKGRWEKSEGDKEPLLSFEDDEQA